MNALNPVRRVGDQIAEPIEVRLGQPRDASRKRAARAAGPRRASPKKRATAYPHELSGGMRQRAMIAMALACDPAIVIGDEPTTALDVMVQAQILQLLEQLRRDLGLSLMLITHDLSVIAETCDKVMVMYAGHVAEEGPVHRVFTAPRHPYTQALLGAYPNIHADRRTLEVIPGMPPDLRNPPPGCRFAPRCAFAMPVCTRSCHRRSRSPTVSGWRATSTRPPMHRWRARRLRVRARGRRPTRSPTSIRRPSRTSPPSPASAASAASQMSPVAETPRPGS